MIFRLVCKSVMYLFFFKMFFILWNIVLMGLRLGEYVGRKKYLIFIVGKKLWSFFFVLLWWIVVLLDIKIFFGWKIGLFLFVKFCVVFVMNWIYLVLFEGLLNIFMYLILFILIIVFIVIFVWGLYWVNFIYGRFLIEWL